MLSLLFYVGLHDRGRVQWLGVMSSGDKGGCPRRHLETPGPAGGWLQPLMHSSNSNPASLLCCCHNSRTGGQCVVRAPYAGVPVAPLVTRGRLTPVSARTTVDRALSLRDIYKPTH